MRQNFTWYGIGNDVTSHRKMCQIYNRLKSSSRKPTAPLVDYRVGNPMNRIAIYIMGPLPITKNKNIYLLVIGDYFTRWMEIYPILHQNADIIAEKLVQEFIASFGTPLEIHTDQGRNFETAYRSSPHPATGHTPNFMMLGREINISSSILFPFPKEKDYNIEDQYITEITS
ncbi:Hypothetical predicted protein [Mytilus galloprovincialis]|uniref:Integrase catalytic domain-containing protein n=1 Tax=Mytilus galloprovincialis TaxID=29158 RepID=A0A8B6FIE4_MYTGA|nr:Hypothetical predicted protein [Mytilus galloprovincialis]